MKKHTCRYCGEAITSKLALAKLLAKYKWQRDYLAKNCADGYWTEDGWRGGDDESHVIADLDARYEAHVLREVMPTDS